VRMYRRGMPCVRRSRYSRTAKSTSLLKSVLLQELRETHNVKGWFASVLGFSGFSRNAELPVKFRHGLAA
jgi:hypothetical protein